MPKPVLQVLLEAAKLASGRVGSNEHNNVQEGMVNGIIHCDNYASLHSSSLLIGLHAEREAS